MARWQRTGATLAAALIAIYDSASRPRARSLAEEEAEVEVQCLLQKEADPRRVEHDGHLCKDGGSKDLVVAYVTDEEGLGGEGLPASLLSLGTSPTNAPPRWRLAVHLVLPRAATAAAGRLVACVNEELRRRGRPALAVTLHEERPDRVGAGTSGRSPSFSARWRLPDYLLPRGHASRVLYLDADTVVQGHLGPLFCLPMEHALGVVPQRGTLETEYVRGGVDEVSGLVNDTGVRVLNAGVLLIDLHRWQRERIADNLAAWAENTSVWDDQLLLNLEFQLGRRPFQALSEAWNLLNLGGAEEPPYTPSDVRSARILHFSRPLKPGLPSDRESLAFLFAPHRFPWRYCRAPSAASDGDDDRGVSVVATEMRAHLITMAFPWDATPAGGPLLGHQVRMLAKGLSVRAERLTVLANNPPWLASAAGGGTAALNKTDILVRAQRNVEAPVTVKDVDYGKSGNASYLGRFFARAPTICCGKAAAVSASDALNMTDIHHTKGSQIASNLLGMLHVLEECVGGGDRGSAGDESDLCIYLDPDIFVHVSNDLPHGEEKHFLRALFEKDSRLLSLQPPTVCDAERPHQPLGEGGGAGDGAADGAGDGGPCRVEPSDWGSSRYMIVSRERLRRRLPLEVPTSHEQFPDRFEMLFSAASGGGALGRLSCGHGREFFAIHPSTPRITAGALDFREHIRLLLASARGDDDAAGGGGGGARRGSQEECGDDDREEGTRILAERLEAGLYPPHAAANNCQDMTVSPWRIARGAAW